MPTHTFTIGHCAIHSQPLPVLHELRFIRKPHHRGEIQLRTIACDDEEFHAVCDFLATRRISHLRPAPAAKRVRSRKGKQN